MNKKTERKQNLALLIDTLRRYGPLTQARLKDYCGVQASTISYIVNDLKKSSLLIDTGQMEQNGKVGKPGNLLTLNGDDNQVLGIYVEDDLLHIHRVGLDGKTYISQEVPFDGEHVQDAVSSIIECQLKDTPAIHGIGLAIKAIVYKDGQIKSGLRNSPGGGEETWNFTDLPGALRQAFPHIPILVENDANCAAALYHYENRLQDGNLAVYLLNKSPFGIGIGLIMQGSVYKGATGAAGEYFDQDGHIRRMVKEVRTGNNLDIQLISAILPHILQTVYLIDPECIVLSGGYFESLQPEILACIEELFQSLPIRIHVAGGDQRLCPAKGVALLAANTYIASFVEEVTKR